MFHVEHFILQNICMCSFFINKKERKIRSFNILLSTLRLKFDFSIKSSVKTVFRLWFFIILFKTCGYIKMCFRLSVARPPFRFPPFPPLYPPSLNFFSVELIITFLYGSSPVEREVTPSISETAA